MTKTLDAVLDRDLLVRCLDGGSDIDFLIVKELADIKVLLIILCEALPKDAVSKDIEALISVGRRNTVTLIDAIEAFVK